MKLDRTVSREYALGKLSESHRADFAAASDTILSFTATYNTHQAHPFTWKKGVRFYHRLKDKLAGSVSAVAA